MSSTDSPTPTIPLIRDCRPGGLRPLLAPGGRDTYFAADVQRMLFAADEPLARFLPPAKWTMPERQEKAQDGRSPQVAYTIPDEIIKTASPLTTLPRTEIDAFADAVTVFLSKARPEAKGVTPYMRQCRQEFRVPNPDLDPSAYWVYGPEFDRRLVILWGCEQQAGTSLTLEKAMEKLRAREMVWGDKEELALKLALRADEPLARFLAPRTPDGGLLVAGVAVSPKKMKRLKHLTPGQWRAFESAAKAYYAKAHPAAAGPAPFEKELRREFRLPSLEKAPGDFYSVGSRLVIALDTWPRESTLPITDDPVLKLPEPAAATASVAAGSAAGPTVSAQLHTRLQPGWVPYAKIAAAAAIVVAVGISAWLLRPDRTPPALVATKAIDDTTVMLSFSKPIAKTSLPPKATAAGVRNQDPLAFFDDKMKIASRELSASDPRNVFVHVEGRLGDGEKYGIAVTQLTDTASTPNVIAPSNAEFTYYDERAPKLVTPSAGGKTKKNLLLAFSKPVAESSLTPSRFTIYPLDAGQRGKRVNIVGAQLDSEDKSGATVLLEANDDFVGGKTYVLDITGVTDRAVRPNPVEEKTAINREFRYVNVLPPRLGDVVASGGKFAITLGFNVPVDPAVAKDGANYTVTGPDKKELRLSPGGIQIDETGSQVILQLEPQRLTTGKHQLVIARMADRQGNKTAKSIERTFEFNDATNRTPLVIARAELNGSHLRLLFDRALAPDTAFSAARYRILDYQRRAATGIEVKSADAVAGEPARVALQLSRAPGAGQYFIEASGLADVFGNTLDTPAVGGFQVSGIFITAPSLIDWARPPVLRGGGPFLVIAINDRVTEASAKTLSNYDLQPDTLQVERVESVVPGTEDRPETVVTLRLTTPASPPVSVAAHGLILKAYPDRGPQTLRLREAQLAP